MICKVRFWDSVGWFGAWGLGLGLGGSCVGFWGIGEDIFGFSRSGFGFGTE